MLHIYTHRQQTSAQFLANSSAFSLSSFLIVFISSRVAWSRFSPKICTEIFYIMHICIGKMVVTYSRFCPPYVVTTIICYTSITSCLPFRFPSRINLSNALSFSSDKLSFAHCSLYATSFWNRSTRMLTSTTAASTSKDASLEASLKLCSTATWKGNVTNSDSVRNDCSKSRRGCRK